MRIAISSILFLVAITAVGAYYQYGVTPYVVIGAICAVTVLVAIDKIKPREYPIYIFGMSLALLWQTSMLGSYIVGADIHGEFFVVNKAVVEGWDFGYVNANNTSIVLGGLAPLLARFGFDPVWQFKALYPAIFACVPVILYFAYGKMLGEKRAYFASLFFIVVPVFFVEIVGIVKSMVAEVFLALMVLFMAVDIKHWQRAVGIGVAVAMATLCHYTIGVLAVAYLVGGFAVLLVGRVIRVGFLQGARMPVVYSSLVIIVALVVTVLWHGSVSEGIILGRYKDIGRNIADRTVGYFSFISIGESGGDKPVLAPATADIDASPDSDDSPNSIVPVEPKAEPAPATADIDASPDSGDSSKSIVPVEPKVEPSPSYLTRQEPLMKTAIGLDFGDASAGGKGFRVLQYITQLLLIFGFVYLVFRHKRYGFTAEYMACTVGGFGLIGMCVFFPLFSVIINASRFYQVALFFLAPILIIGVEELGNDLSRGVVWLKRHQ